MWFARILSCPRQISVAKCKVGPWPNGGLYFARVRLSLRGAPTPARLLILWLLPHDRWGASGLCTDCNEFRLHRRELLSGIRLVPLPRRRWREAKVREKLLRLHEVTSGLARAARSLPSGQEQTVASYAGSGHSLQPRVLPIFRLHRP